MASRPLWHPVTLTATWFGSGLSPVAPGTAGSLAALPFAWILAVYLGPWGLTVASLIAVLVGLWAAQAYSIASGDEDPGAVVIDEVAGQWLALIPAAIAGPTLWQFAVGFALFRIADIGKPWPANWIDRRLSGGVGIMLDDVVAGLYAAAGLAMMLYLIGEWR